MDAQYRKLNGTPVPHLANYAKSYLRAHPEVSLSVGTDSQNIGGSSVYATVVAFRHPAKECITYLPKKENLSSQTSSLDYLKKQKTASMLLNI